MSNRRLSSYGFSGEIYAQNDDGLFTRITESGSSESVNLTYTRNTILSATPTISGKYVSGYYNIAPSDTEQSYALLLIHTNVSFGSTTRIAAVNTAYSTTVTITDAHGRHYGSPSGRFVTEYYGCVIVQHEPNSEDSGWRFVGWRVRGTRSWGNPFEYSSSLKAASPSSVLYSPLADGSAPTSEHEEGTDNYKVEYIDGYEYAVVLHLSPYADDDSIVIEALYEASGPITRTISLDANGGSVSPSSVSCTSTYANAVSIIPTRSGWQFLGWFDSASGGSEIVASTPLTQSSPSTLYAHWEEIPVGTYAITYNPNGGTGGPESTTVTQGDSYTIPSDVPTRSSYTFNGWYIGEETVLRQPGYLFTPTGDTTITAQWSGGPRPPRPEERKDYMVYGGTGGLNYSSTSGALVYAV